MIEITHYLFHFNLCISLHSWLAIKGYTLLELSKFDSLVGVQECTLMNTSIMNCPCGFKTSKVFLTLYVVHSYLAAIDGCFALTDGLGEGHHAKGCCETAFKLHVDHLEWMMVTHTWLYGL